MAKKGQVEIQVKLDSADAQKKATGFFGDLKNKAKDLGSSFSQMGGLAKAGLVGAIVAGAAMAVNALVDVGKAIINIGKEAAQFQNVKNAFGAMARGMGQDAEVMLEKMRTGIKGTVNDLTLMTEANKAMMLGLDMKRVDEMMNIALAASKATGQSVEQTTAAILGGLAEQKANMLESVGITFDANAAYAEYAKSIGKTADQLTNAEKKQAFLNEALKVGNKMAGAVGTGGLLTFDQALAKIGAGFDNIKAKLSATMLPALTALANMAAKAMDKMAALFKGGEAEGVSTSIFDKIGKAVAYVGGFISGYIGSWIKLFKGLGDVIKSVAKVMEESFAMMKAVINRDTDAAAAAFERLQAATENSIKVQGDLAITFAKAGLPAAVKNAHEAMDEYSASLVRVREEQEKAAQSAGKLGSSLDSAAPAKAGAPAKGGGGGWKGLDFGSEIDKASGAEAGFGGSLLSGIGTIKDTLVNSWNQIKSAELQMMGQRAEQINFFTGLFVTAAMNAKDEEIRIHREKWEAIMEQERAGYEAMQEQINQNLEQQLGTIRDAASSQAITEKEKADKITQAQAFAQEQRDKATKDFNKKQAENEAKKNAEMKRLEEERAAQEKSLKKQQALIGWVLASAQMEAQKRVQMTNIQISAISGAAQVVATMAGMLGPIGLVIGAGLAASIIAAAQVSRAAVASQFVLPPAELFLAEGGVVMPRPGGVRATIAEAGVPEAVIPLDKMGGMMGGGVTINVQNLYATDDLPAKLVDMIDKELYMRARVGQSVFAAEVSR